MSRCYRFNHAIVRAPGEDVMAGLRAVDTGSPDLQRFLAHHAAYVRALRETGATVIELAALAGHPDAVFVEDAALCLADVAIAMRPGAPSRLAEAAHMIDTLRDVYHTVLAIEGPGYIEGGDILVTDREILIGRSARTDADGIDELRRLVGQWDYTVREVETPSDVLHFKTDCALLDEETILATPRLSRSGCFDGYKVIHTAPGEDAAANAVRFNDIVLLAAGFARTADTLSASGYDVREIPNSEAAKLDGGMSCLSLRFDRSAD